ncbi:MAG: TonB-dependent receptor [Steroidobacteraceae bacterium]
MTLFGTAGALTVGIAMAADATDASATAAAETSTGAPMLETIVVTARKVEESAQSVPQAIVALSEDDLKESNVFTVQDLQEHVTGLVISPDSQGGAPTFAVRASKQDNGTDGGVAVYIDDVPMAATQAIANSMYDIASVDVLKGPQGTLFGVNTTGGAVVFRPNKPTDQLDGYVEAEGGNYSRAYFEGMANIPISDVLQFRVAGNLMDRGGFVNNLTPEPQDGIPASLDNLHYRSLRATMRLNLGPITNDITGTYYHEDDSGPIQIAVDLLKGFPPQAPGPASLGATVLGPWTVSEGGNLSGINLPMYNRDRVWGVEDAFNWNINDAVTFHNALSYYDDYLDTFQDNDGTNIDLVNGRTRSDIEYLIEEPTLHVKLLDGKLRYTGGAYWSHQIRDDGNSYDLAQNYLYGLPANFLFPGQPASPVAELTNAYYQRNKHSFAVYSQVDYDLTNELTMTLGGRYNWDRMELVDSQHGGGLGAPEPNPNFLSGPCNVGILKYYGNFNPTTCQGMSGGDWHAPSYTWALSDKFRDGGIVYFKIAHGYQAGGLNNQIREQAYQSFLPEKTTEFESGIKVDWTLGGMPVRTNVDAFYGHADNKQEVENGAYADGTQWIAVFNAGSLSYFGADVDAEVYLTRYLKLSADYTHINASYDNFVFPAIGILPQTNLTGASPAQIPANTFSGGATFYWPLPDVGGKVSTNLTVFTRSTITFADIVNLSGTLGTLNSSDAVGQSYTTLNFSTYWKDILGSHLTAGVWVKNLSNELYRTFAGPQASLGYGVVDYGEPRTVGVNLRYDFR